MNARQPFIEAVDDGSADAGALIDRNHSCGLISRIGRDPLWLGLDQLNRGNGWHPRLTRSVPSGIPTVVSFYTSATPYEKLASALRDSCDRFGVQCIIEPREPRGSWERNCAMKAGFVREMRERLTGPILWVDADAHLAGPLDDLRLLKADFAAHLLDGWRMLSGTVYFDDTPQAARLIERWHERCEAEPDIWDQIHLDLAWEDTAREHDLTTAWFDERFAKIFDRPADLDPVIVHTQASRRHKREVSAGVRGAEQVPDGSVRLARSCSRVRPGPPLPARACTIIGEADDSADRWQQRRTETMVSAYRLCLNRGFSRIALVGAGRHTREVALPAAADCSIGIACVLDDRAGDTEPIDGLPIVALSDCPDGVEALIISSDAHEETLAQRCRAVLGDRLPIIEPYRQCAANGRGAAVSGTGSR